MRETEELMQLNSYTTQVATVCLGKCVRLQHFLISWCLYSLINTGSPTFWNPKSKRHVEEACYWSKSQTSPL